MRTLSESPDLRWFEDCYRQKCHRCGKRADGILRGKMNESYGAHCQRCADARLKASQKVRDAEVAS